MARHHGNDDGAQWTRHPGRRLDNARPLRPPQPSRVAIPPSLCYTAKTANTGAVPGLLGHNHASTRTKDHHDDAAWLVTLGRRPCLAVKLGTTAHHVTSTAELLDGTAADPMDHGETVSPPPGTPIQKKISQVKE
ncbi:hypothetical protein WOLCODRAFT_153412 [Wolfiporia cocos MD-104 SS10]|uniref:Uncharacterized protein n=1 Tax=Wolfiporia cocos (strain MD-104) TaxID=742152 RepID=A0A2H3JWS7_WOLCO|nr:hypothetical protein WOLCODRAFT_153412 [Wolfiporia cocos MD-104 SS10]